MTNQLPPPDADPQLPSAARPPRFWNEDEQLLGAFAVGPILIALLLLAPVLVHYKLQTAITLGLPAALGALAGAVAPRASILMMICPVLAVILGLAAGLWTLELAGVFCGVIYAVVAMPPALLAGLLVIALRRRVAWYRRVKKGWLGPTLVGLPLALHAIERSWPVVYGDEQLVMAREIAAPVDRVFRQSLAVDAASVSPWERIQAPLPVAVAGRASAPGDVKTMVFGKGVITVRVRAVEPGRRLVADVIEQTIEQRALGLSTVTVACDPLGAERTLVQLQLDFEPRMGPRWYWRPFERWFGGISFDAVLTDWQREATKPWAPPGG